MTLRGVSQSFRDRADPAAFWEAWVGAVLARAGLYTTHCPFEIDGKDHGQTFDLMVGTCPEGDYYDMKPVEVKSLKLTFNDPDTYPFDEVLVCSQNSFLRKWPGRDYSMRDFLFVSTQTGSIVWLPSMTKVTLGREIRDNSRNEVYKAVSASKDMLRPLDEFVEYIKGNAW